jgi:hypothetical protein
MEKERVRYSAGREWEGGLRKREREIEIESIRK